MEDAGYAVKCAEKAPTTRDGLVVAAVEGSDGEANGGAGSCHEPGPAVQHTSIKRYCVYVVYSQVSTRAWVPPVFEGEYL